MTETNMLRSTATKCFQAGRKYIHYKPFEWICKELNCCCKLKEIVNAICSEDDSINFLMEINRFLKEIGLFLFYDSYI